MKNDIKVIAFDFGGVIVPGIILEWVKSLPKNDARIPYFASASHKWDMGEMSIDEFYKALSHITKIPLDTIRKTYYKKPKVFHDVVALIKKLKKHYKVALFTNNFAHNLERYFDELDMHGFFDELIISSEHKIKKPNPEFYKKMLEIVHAKPGEIIFIDDSQANIDAGNSVGIRSLLFTNVDDLKGKMTKLGVTV